MASLRVFVRRRVPFQDSEDVTQDVLVRVFQGLPSLQGESRIEAWIHGIARNAVADYFRARTPDEQSEDLDDLPSTEAASLRGFASFEGEHSTHEEVLTWLRPIAEELPEIYRDALIQADFEGQTQTNLAKMLGLSVSGTKSRVQRARGLLANRLKACCEIELDPEGRAVDFKRKDCLC